MADGDLAHAFNAGCDARLRGESLHDCPYAKAEEKLHWQYWRYGWRDVDRFWATEHRKERRRTPCRPT